MMVEFLAGDALVWFVGALLAYLIANAGARLAAEAKFLPDVPNHRSSHRKVTSKAGGLAIFSAWFISILMVTAFDGVGDAVAGARVGILTLLAFGLGLSDDRWRLNAFSKFVGQLLIALVFAFAIAQIDMLPLPFVGEVELGPFAIPVTVLWIVAFMNIFNFMDGANGLAAGVGIIGLCVFAVVIAMIGGSEYAVAALALSAAILGFFRWNMRRGAIFMGDGGSQGIAFFIAAAAVSAGQSYELSILFVPLIFLPFIFDAAITLTHRLLRRQRITDAHREHLYQLLLRSGWRHERVAVFYCALTALTAAAAVIMLTMPSMWRWAVIGGAVILLGCVALLIYRETWRSLSGRENMSPPEDVAGSD